MTKKAVLYARINNCDEPKLREQLQMCREYARDHGWQIVAELGDRGVSGLSNNAPQLDHVLKMARAGEFNVLIVREPNRLSRDLARMLAIAGELEQAGIQIIYACNGRHDGSAGASEQLESDERKLGQ